MQVCPDNVGFCLFFLLLSYWLLPHRKFASTWDLRLRDLYVLFSLQLYIMLVVLSVVKGGGVEREYVCSCTNIWAVSATCLSTLLEPTSLYT